MAVILIQQTDPDILQVMELILKLEGFDVHGLNGFPAGLADLVASLRPDVVLLDHYHDGHECLGVFRAIRKKGSRIPVLISGCSRTVSDFCKTHGFDGCVEMPFDLAVFYETVTKSLRDRGISF